MKTQFYCYTLFLQFLTVLSMHFFESWWLFALVFVGCIAAGFILRFSDAAENKLLEDLSWGLLMATLTSGVVLLGLAIWLITSIHSC